jgi:hypothetical protein
VRQIKATSFANEYLPVKNKLLLFSVHQSDRSKESTAQTKSWTVLPKLKRKALETWQPTEIL